MLILIENKKQHPILRCEKTIGNLIRNNLSLPTNSFPQRK